jgi:hypothetical protein
LATSLVFEEAGFKGMDCYFLVTKVWIDLFFTSVADAGFPIIKEGGIIM